MIVYEATKKQFLQDSDNDDIEEVILQHFKAVTGKSVGNSEINSWKGSLGYMAKVLRDEEMPDDTGLAIELHIPQTSKRIDITLTGRDESGAKNAVLVELKQWSKASATGKDAIVRTALGNGLREVVHPSYASQFRCNGSDGYLAWLDDVLDIRPTANQQLDASQYDFKVFDTPEALHAAIAARNQDNKARVVAGYCWPWRSKKDPRQQDIVIGDYQRQWNLDQDGSLWIIAENSIEQVGCIHTCQGLEVDYIGVIIGPDLIVRDGKIITAPEQRDRHDKSIRGYKKLMKENPELARKETDLIIKNTYRTLMTRGMKGCYVFCTDEETARYFRGRGGR